MLGLLALFLVATIPAWACVLALHALANWLHTPEWSASGAAVRIAQLSLGLALVAVTLRFLVHWLLETGRMLLDLGRKNLYRVPAKVSVPQHLNTARSAQEPTNPYFEAYAP